MRYFHLFIIIAILVLYYLLGEKKENFKTESSVVQTIRKMLKDIDALLGVYDIPYWIDGGTLLGAVRHQNVIPWDDDGDICIPYTYEHKLVSLEGRLYELGYGLSKFWGGYKIYPLNGMKIKDHNKNWSWQNMPPDFDDNVSNYRFPFVDVFFTKKEEGNIVFSNKYVRQMYNKYYHKEKDLMPLKRYKFHDFKLNGPNNATPYLNRAFKNWETVGYKSYDHLNKTFIKPVVFKL